jgi:hypothetical protein
VYRELTNCHGFCSVYHFGTQDNYNVMVMDLLGPSLEDLFNKCSRRFSLKTVLQIADQLLERVDTLHSRHLIHRDIKPANFVIGVGDQGANVYCVDFGLSKRYRHPKNLQHIPHRDGRSLTGTPRYASINNHLGIEQSRRDDLESIGYVLIYFLKGSLPWQGLKAKNAQKKYRMILEKKQSVSIAQLCQGCPSQFAEFLAYTRSLKFDAKPDIPYLRKLFRDMYHAQGCASVGKLWDWTDLQTTDYDAGETPASGGGPPPAMQQNPPRPSTAAAVAAPGTGIESDAMLMGGEGDYGGQAAATGRPNTAGAMGSRGAGGGQAGGQWSGAQKAGTGGYSGNGLTQGDGYSGDGNARRPHTANATGRTSGGAAASGYQGQQQMAVDSRTGKPVHVGGEGEEEGDDAHVVAGARAMMRYRRTRATSHDGQGGPGGGSGGGAPSQPKGWTGSSGDQYGAQPRAIYQNPNKTSAQQQQLMQQQQMTRGSKTSGVQQQQQAGGIANLNGSQGWMSGAQSSDSRPRSAGVMNSLTGNQQSRPSSSGAAAQGQQQQNSLSYGSLRSRFLSSGGGTGSGQKGGAADGQQQGKSASASKLFSISR